MVEGLFGVFSALLVVGAGSILAIVQLRKTRGFDRRLEWCESMMRAINAAGAAVASATMSQDPAGREVCWTHVIRLYERLIPLCGLKELYAPAAAVEQIRVFMVELERLIEAHLAGHDSGESTDDCDGSACLDELRRAAGSLARLARGHLKLEPLPDEMADPGQWFVGSFRGRRLGVHEEAFR